VTDRNSDLPEHSLDFYSHSGPMTELGPHRVAFAELADIPSLARVMHGLLLHTHWAPAYGQKLSPDRRETEHLRRIGDLLDAAMRIDPAPLTTPRPPERRIVGVCSHYSLLAVAVLRSQGTPARARCGFGAYFEPSRAIDHWIVEYRDRDRWISADFQIDAVQAPVLKLDFDVLDQPPGKFLRAGEAWQASRRGDLDPMSCGLFDEGGYWFIAQNLLRDLAALNKTEMLPWDVWGMMPRPSDPMPDELMEELDQLAELTVDVDERFDALRQRYEDSERVHVPTSVRNAVRQRIEPVFPD
jgi:hypothetical protein